MWPSLQFLQRLLLNILPKYLNVNLDRNMYTLVSQLLFVTVVRRLPDLGALHCTPSGSIDGNDNPCGRYHIGYVACHPAFSKAEETEKICLTTQQKSITRGLQSTTITATHYKANIIASVSAYCLVLSCFLHKNRVVY